MNVGDKVWYWPDECHALIPDASSTITQRQYPWKIGRRLNDAVVELSGDKLRKFLQQIRGEPRGSDLAKQLVRIVPKIKWPATVTAVNDDGTVSLDVKGSNSATTLHYPSVKVIKDTDAPKGNTCFADPIKEEAAAVTESEEEGGDAWR